MSDFITSVITKILTYLLFALIIWGLWEPVMVQIFSLPDINYWQSVMVYVMAETLFSTKATIKVED